MITIELGAIKTVLIVIYFTDRKYNSGTVEREKEREREREINTNKRNTQNTVILEYQIVSSSNLLFVMVVSGSYRNEKTAYFLHLVDFVIRTVYG